MKMGDEALLLLLQPCVPLQTTIEHYRPIAFFFP